MRTPKCFFATVVICFLMNSAATVGFAAVQENVAATRSDSETVNSAEQFSQAVELAEEGKEAKAFRIAKAAKAACTPDRFMSVNYVNTLVTIAEQDGKSHDAKILNEAIQEVNEVSATKVAAGDKDPEIAYHFMVATGRLADELMPRSEQIASHLMVQEGAIASRLKVNPAYPKESLAVLSKPIFDKARAFAIQGKEDEAFGCLSEAFELGFVKFDQVSADEHLAKLTDQVRLEKMTDTAEQAYVQKVDAWSQKALREFARIPFRLNVPSVDGKRLTQEDFAGKVMVIDLWATWCSPCRECIPHFVELDQQFEGEGVAVIGISMDNPADPASTRETVRKFNQDNGVTYASGLGDASVTDQLPGKQLLPTTVFVDRAGNVRFIATGVHDIYQLSAITKRLADESQAISTHRRVH